MLRDLGLAVGARVDEAVGQGLDARRRDAHDAATRLHAVADFFTLPLFKYDDVWSRKDPWPFFVEPVDVLWKIIKRS